ncbi:peptidyl-tRNA hydrolase [Pisolithus croceorrhizus]|nr:peptidyl-tRNA hydrolase [Pisolithus croceorrhizus]
MTTWPPRLLVVGLGNLPYPNTRHSVGHVIVDALAARFGVHMSMNRSVGGFIGHSDVLFSDDIVSLTLFKPKSLMNITGPSVASALRNTVKLPTSMVVVHDSLDHKVKVLSVKLGGSANGHNGVRSVIDALGANADFYRFRIGIGRDRAVDPAEYVLSKMPPDELQHWNDVGLDRVCIELGKIASRNRAT